MQKYSALNRIKFKILVSNKINQEYKKARIYNPWRGGKINQLKPIQTETNVRINNKKTNKIIMFQILTWNKKYFLKGWFSKVRNLE